MSKIISGIKKTWGERWGILDKYKTKQSDQSNELFAWEIYCLQEPVNMT